LIASDFPSPVFQSYVQEQNEDKVCNFISNLVQNKYDEYGEIYLDNDGWTQYIPDPAKMTSFQKLALSSAILLCIGLLFYSCYLYNVISKSKYNWYPQERRGYSSDQGAGAPMQRMHSGIIQGRSRSGNGFGAKDGGTFA